LHHRSDYDLVQHSKFSGQDLFYRGEDGSKFYPFVIEASGGVDRTFLALLFDCYKEEGDRVLLSLPAYLAPYKVAVFPLLANKPELVEKAREIFKILQPEFHTTWDDRGNIGKRYYSQDEIGTPYCVTVDFETLKDNAVTIRDRDTMKQIRVGIDQLTETIKQLVNGIVEFEKAGKMI